MEFSMNNIAKKTATVFLIIVAAGYAGTLEGWKKGRGFGWVWGNDDQLGAIQAILTPDRILQALNSVTTGKVYDLGVPLDQYSYKWPGHSPTSIVSYRSPVGVKTEKDIGVFNNHPSKMAFHSCALYISDNLGTQIDGLGHISKGEDNHWYNGFKESEHAGDFGLFKTDADGIPPIIGTAVMVDVAAWKGVDALPSNFPIGSKEIKATLRAQNTQIKPGDMVFLRTGTLRYWGANGSNHVKIGEHDSAGITLEGAAWLVEQKGVVLIGADTSGAEVGKDPARPDVANLVHEYLLIDQGVHIGEFHNLEQLSANKVYRFLYVATTNRLKGTVAGTAMRPIAIE
tara:strand:- start:1062 stop:2087 length:1026 start_codon:yes stop_codon:yes gene_type:complete